MDNERPSLSPDQIEDLCRRYREAERSREVLFERCDVRFSPQSRPVDRPRSSSGEE